MAAKASATAARVAEVAQDFTEKTYRDQVAMGRPSIAAMSGETFVSSIDPPEAKYSLRIMLRNSGVRTTEHAWVVAAPGGADMATDALPVQVMLPKDVDVPVQFDLRGKPATDSRTEWYVGVATHISRTAKTQVMQRPRTLLRTYSALPTEMDLFRVQKT